MQGWEDFTVITGGASAALVGLLFVAVSIRADSISHSIALRARLAQTLTIFLGFLVASILISLPNPANWVLGVELIVAALLIGVAFFILDRRAMGAGARTRLEKIVDRLNPCITTAVLIGLAGVCLVLGLEWGLFFVALAARIAFGGGVVGAWLVLVLPDV